VVDTSQPRYFAIADGVAIGMLPRTASHRRLPRFFVDDFSVIVLTGEP